MSVTREMLWVKDSRRFEELRAHEGTAVDRKCQERTPFVPRSSLMRNVPHTLVTFLIPVARKTLCRQRSRAAVAQSLAGLADWYRLWYKSR